MKSKFFIMIVILCMTVNVSANTNKNSYYYEEKDPFVAGLLSAAMMGLGQFYVKEYTNGSLFVLTDFLQKGALIWIIASLNDKYTDDTTNDKIVEWNEITDKDKALLMGYMVFYFGSELYCIIDAVHSANEYNKRAAKSFEGDTTGLNFGIGKNKFLLSYSGRF